MYGGVLTHGHALRLLRVPDSWPLRLLRAPAAISVSVACPKVGLTLVTPCAVDTTPPTARALAAATKQSTPETGPSAAVAAAAAAAAAADAARAPPAAQAPSLGGACGQPVKLSYISLSISGVSFKLPNVHQIRMQVRTRSRVAGCMYLQSRVQVRMRTQ